MLRTYIELTGLEQDDYIHVAGAVQTEQGANDSSLPRIEHTHSNLEHWSRTVRSLNAGRAIGMIIVTRDEEELRRLQDGVSDIKTKRQLVESYWESRDLADAAYEL